MKNILKLINQGKCNGCSACLSICPVDAITMRLDDEGFFMPGLEKEKCISCGKCVHVCPVYNIDKQPTNELNQFYMFQGDDEVRQKCSSGGVFYYLASKVMNNGGVVFGVAYDRKQKIVRHISTDECNIEEILRSKYVQSDIGRTFQKIQNHLKNDRVVLFAGTPCQVAGLYSFLGICYDKLFTVDFICHGVPSTGYFKDMILYEEKNNNCDLKNITFREKEQGWRKLAIKLYFDNGNVISCIGQNNIFFNQFINNITLRKSCFKCNFPNKHAADITIFDYWSIKHDDDLGVSACVLHSEKGKDFFLSCVNSSRKIDFSKKYAGFIPHNKLLDYDQLLRESFFLYYKKNGYEKSIKIKWPKIKKVLSRKKALKMFASKIKRKIKHIG